MKLTKILVINRRQAIRLPRHVAFPNNVRDVAILRDGARRLLVPANAIWDDFFAAAGIDLPLREQPEIGAPDAG